MDSLPEDAGAGPLAVLSRFRLDFHACLTARADELSELADGVLCADGPVRTLARLSLGPEHRRGHGALYDAVNHGRIDIGRLRRSLAGLPLPRAADGRLVLAVDVSNWLRPGAVTSPGRLFCHVYGRGKGQAQMIPGWPYSVIAALEPGRTSWTAVLDAVRLGPDDDEAEVTAGQVRDVVTRLVEAGHWGEGDPAILVIFDAGYDVTRLAWLLGDLPVELLGRLRSDRVMKLPAPPNVACGSAASLVGENLAEPLVPVRRPPQLLPRDRIGLLIGGEVRVPFHNLPVGEPERLGALAEPPARRLPLLGGIEVVPARSLLPRPAQVILKIKPGPGSHHRHREVHLPRADRTVINFAAERSMII